MENNEQCRPAEVLWNHMIDIKTDGMVGKKTGDLKMWSQDRVGGRRTGITLISTQIRYRSYTAQWVCMLHGTRMGKQPTLMAGNDYLPQDGGGESYLSGRLSCFLFAQALCCSWLKGELTCKSNGRFKWQASCTGQNTFSEPFARTRIYLWFHVSDVGQQGSQEFPAWCWNLSSASRNCNLQRGAPTDGCPSLSANNFQPPEYFK